MLLFLPWLLVEIFTLKSEHLNYRGIIGGLSAANIQYVTCCQEYMTANRKLTRGLDSLPCRCCFVSQHIHVHWTIFPTARRNTPSEKRLSWNKKTVIFNYLPLDSPVNLYQSSRWCITHIYIYSIYVLMWFVWEFSLWPYTAGAGCYFSTEPL